MKLVVDKVVKETEDAVSLYFKNSSFFKKIKYKSGQFLTIKLKINSNEEKRAYSFSSSPFVDKDLRITIKKVEKGLVSNFVYDNIKAGDKIKVESPTGSFFFEPDTSKSRNVVLFGAGSGVTPVLSIAKTALDQEENTKVIFFYANRDIDSIIFKDEIATLEKQYPQRLTMVHILENNTTKWGNSYEGYLQQEIVDEVFKQNQLDFNKSEYYTCGPQGFMDKVKETLYTHGVDRKKIKMEAFTAPKLKFTGKNLKSEVTIKQGGKENNLTIPGNKTVLQSCITNNIKIPFSCRSGMCSTCKGKCVEGEVTMIDGHTLPEEEVEKGYVLTCVTYPASEKVVIEI